MSFQSHEVRRPQHQATFRTIIYGDHSGYNASGIKSMQDPTDQPKQELVEPTQTVATEQKSE